MIGRFVDQIAGEVLRIGDDARGLQSALEGLGVALHDYGEVVDLLVVLIILAALVVAGLKVAYGGAFHDGAHGVRRGNFRAFRQNAFRQHYGKAADAFCLQGAHRGAGQFAQFGG